MSLPIFLQVGEQSSQRALIMINARTLKRNVAKGHALGDRHYPLALGGHCMVFRILLANIPLHK